MNNSTYSDQSWGNLKIEWLADDEYEHLPSAHRDLGMVVRCYDGRYARLLAVGDDVETVIVTGLDVGEERQEFARADVWVCGRLVYRGSDGSYRRLEV